MTIVYVKNVKKRKSIEISILVSAAIPHLLVIVSRCFSYFLNDFNQNRNLDDRWNDYEESSSSSSSRKKDFVELDGRWRSTNPSIFEEGFNKAEDLASKMKEIVLEQRHPSRDYSPERR